MRLHRFYIKEKVLESHFLSGEMFEINNPELEHQLIHVFRMKTGDEVILFDGGEVDYVVEIFVERKSVRFKITGTTPQPPLVRGVSRRRVTLFMSVIKKDNFEMIVEKVTELGVSEIVPVVTERSQKINLNIDRLNKIAIEATEQSGQSMPPKIHEVMTLDEVLSNFTMPKIVFHTEGETFHKNVSQVFETTIGGESDGLGILVGPEGGWGNLDLDKFKTKNIEMFSLDVPVLRAETAAIILCYTVLVD